MWIYAGRAFALGYTHVDIGTLRGILRQTSRHDDDSTRLRASVRWPCV